MRRRNPNTVREARERAGLTQLEVAIKAQISIGTLSVAERGGPISSRSAQRLATALAVREADLMPRRRKTTTREQPPTAA